MRPLTFEESTQPERAQEHRRGRGQIPLNPPFRSPLREGALGPHLADEELLRELTGESLAYCPFAAHLSQFLFASVALSPSLAVKDPQFLTPETLACLSSGPEAGLRAPGHWHKRQHQTLCTAPLLAGPRALRRLLRPPGVAVDALAWVGQAHSPC